MHFILSLQALFHKKPTTLLSITDQTATLAALQAPGKPYATLSPTPYLLDNQNHLSAGFQLRSFLGAHLPLAARMPFTLIVHLPSMAAHDAQRLATQILAVLLPLKLPAAVITQDNVTTLPVAQLRCVLSNKKTGYISAPPWWLLVACFMSSAVTGYFWLNKTPGEKVEIVEQPRAPITKQPIHQPSVPTYQPLYRTIIAALMGDKPPCSLISVQLKTGTATARYFSPDPQPLYALEHIFSYCTKTAWRMKAPQYKIGYPPLYYVTVQRPHLI